MFTLGSCLWFFGKEPTATNMAEAQKTGARLQGLRPNTALCCAAFGGSGPGAGAGAAGEPGPEGTLAVGGQRRRRKRKGGARGPVRPAAASKQGRGGAGVQARGPTVCAEIGKAPAPAADSRHKKTLQLLKHGHVRVKTLFKNSSSGRVQKWAKLGEGLGRGEGREPMSLAQARAALNKGQKNAVFSVEAE